MCVFPQLLKEKTALWPFVLQSNDREEFWDVPIDQGCEGVERGGGEERKGEGEDRGKVVGGTDGYKINHRNPQFSGAEMTCLWELKEVCTFSMMSLLHNGHNTSLHTVVSALPSISAVLLQEDCLGKQTPISITHSFQTHFSLLY